MGGFTPSWNGPLGPAPASGASPSPPPGSPSALGGSAFSWMVTFSSLTVGTVLESDDLGLRHLVDGESYALATETGAFEAAERHGVDTVVGAVVDHHATVA